MDQNSPYYIYHSEGPSTVKFTPILEGFNYHFGASSICRALGGKMKLEFMDGSIVVLEDQFDPSFHAWNKCNMLVQSWLLNLVSDSIT